MKFCGREMRNSSHKYTTVISSGTVHKQKGTQEKKKPKNNPSFYNNFSLFCLSCLLVKLFLFWGQQCESCQMCVLTFNAIIKLMLGSQTPLCDLCTWLKQVSFKSGEHTVLPQKLGQRPRHTPWLEDQQGLFQDKELKQLMFITHWRFEINCPPPKTQPHCRSDQE